MNDNQNAFVTRSTSRVLAEPGGKSSMGFLFGGGSGGKAKAAAEKEPAEPIVSPQSVADPAADPVADPAAPAEDEEKDKEEEEETAISAAARIKAKNEAQHFSLFSPPTAKAGKKEAASGGALSASAIKAKQEAQHFSLFSPGSGGSGATGKNTTSSNAFASASTTNSYNVITDRSSSRVLAPPGGRSSIKLG